MKGWTQGLSQWWLRDVGCNSFLQAAAVGWLLGIVFLVMDKPDGVGLMFSLALVSVWSASAFQLIRLRAQEGLLLIPGARKHYLTQLTLVLVVCNLLTLAVTALVYAPAINQLLFVISISALFLLVCINRPKWFYASFFLYLSLAFFDEVIQWLPMPAWLPAVIALLAVMAVYLWLRQPQALRWHPGASAITVAGAEMGWMWLPGLTDNAMTMKLSRYLFPLTYFSGPVLGSFVLALVLVSLLLGVLLPRFDIRFPVGFVLLQGAGIGCMLVHWTRILRARGQEMLITLPLFDGHKGLSRALWRAQLNLLLILGLISAVVMILVGLVYGIYWPGVMQLLIVQTTGCALALAGGCLCRKSSHLPWLMVYLMIYSWTAAVIYKNFGDETLSVAGLIWQIPLLLVSLISLKWASGRCLTRFV